jgi:hypothetical protein
MSEMVELIKVVLPYITGGVGGAGITILYNKFKNRIQVMECHYIDEDTISKIPTTVEDGETHQNIYSKQFVLKNTTNCDHKTFRVIFEFDITAKIIRHTDISKSGIDRLKKRLLKPNEYSVNIQNFNRGDAIKFIFEIANLKNDEINVTEDNCLGFKVKLKDKRKAQLKSKLTHVDKEKINAIR